MSRWHRWLLHGANALVSGSGLALAWMVFLLVPDDPEAVAHHPLQPALQHAHVLLAPLLVFAAGVLWPTHIAPKLFGRSRARLWSGVAQIAALLPMIASGYLLQIASEDWLRSIWSQVHLWSGIAWLLGTLAHLIAPRRVRDGE